MKMYLNIHIPPKFAFLLFSVLSLNFEIFKSFLKFPIADNIVIGNILIHGTEDGQNYETEMSSHERSVFDMIISRRLQQVS